MPREGRPEIKKMIGCLADKYTKKRHATSQNTPFDKDPVEYKSGPAHGAPQIVCFLTYVKLLSSLLA